MRPAPGLLPGLCLQAEHPEPSGPHCASASPQPLLSSSPGLVLWSRTSQMCWWVRGSPTEHWTLEAPWDIQPTCGCALRPQQVCELPCHPSAGRGCGRASC